MAQPRGPLAGVKVVACSTAQAGTVPYMLMADLGAEVSKIEVPGVGDGSRRAGQMPGFPSTYYVSISGYGPHGPHAMLPSTDAMAQALGGIAEAFATPGQSFKTGIVSVADETCAILAFGGIMAGLYCAKTTGIGQKIDTSLLGGQIRLMGWTLTTAMWKDENPVTGQARITGAAERPAISASFNDKHGKPFVFQMGGRDWKQAMTALGFAAEMQEKGFDDLGVAVTSASQREAMLKTLDALFATDSRDKWVEILRQADIVSAPINTLLEASHDPDVLANG